MLSTRKLVTLLIFFALHLPGLSLAQERGKPYIRNFSHKEYNGNTQNWSITQDLRGVLYVGNQQGVLQYDGETWQAITVPNQSTVRSLGIDKATGVVYAGCADEIGYLSPNELGKLQYVSLVPLIDSANRHFADVWTLQNGPDGMYFLTDLYLFRYNPTSGVMTTWKKQGDYFYTCGAINGAMYVHELGVGLKIVKGDSLVMMPKGETMARERVFSMLSYDNETILFALRGKGLVTYNTKNYNFEPFENEANQFLIDNRTYHGAVVNLPSVSTSPMWAFATIQKGIVIVNKEGKAWEYINKSSGLQNETVYYLFQGKHGELWAGLEHGVSRMDIHYPIRYWDEVSGITGTILDVYRYNGIVYVATGNGIYRSQTKPTDLLTSFSHIDSIAEQSWCLTEFKTGNKSMLLAGTAVGLYQVGEKSSHLIKGFDQVYKVYSVPGTSRILLCLREGLAILDYQNGKWVDWGNLKNLNYEIREAILDHSGGIWLATDYNGLVRISKDFQKSGNSPVKSWLQPDSVMISIYDTAQGLPKSLRNIQLFELEGDIKFATENGLYKFDQVKNRFERDMMFGNRFTDSKNWINRIVKDAQGNFWINGNVLMKKTDNGYEEDSLRLRAVPTDIYEAMYPDSANRLWLGSDEGLYCVETSARSGEAVFNTFLRDVVIGKDSLVFGGTFYSWPKDVLPGGKKRIISPIQQGFQKPIISYDNNSITFRYSALFFGPEESNEYSYYLKGFDDGWSDWSKEPRKEYTNLFEGDYTFYIKSRNIFQVASEVLQYSFSVNPPWYRSIAAYFIYIISAVIFIWIIVIFNTLRLKKEKQRLERIIEMRTAEIVQQKEEILVQAENLLRANTNITKQNEALEEQKNELQRANATKDRFFSIIAHDLRSPLATLVSLINILHSDFESFSPQKLKMFITNMYGSAEKTFKLLENLLDWSRSQKGEISFEPRHVSLSDLSTETHELLLGNANDKKIELINEVPDGLMAFCDENMTRTILRNLVSNAIKFSWPGGTVRISGEFDGGSVRLRVSDTGIGISQKDIDKLFKLDTHHSTLGTKNEKGTGLGLILCKEFTEKQGGTIQVSSVPEQGSTFEFSLPRNNLFKTA